MKNVIVCWIFLVLPLGLWAQLKSFELTNPIALELSDSTLQLLSSQAWRVLQIDTDVRGVLTETETRRVLKYNADGSFTYLYSGTWEVVDNKYIKHTFKDEKDKKVNFGGIYAVIEISSTKLTLSKSLTSSYDMKRTMYFEPVGYEPLTTSASSSRIKPIFSASSKLYTGKTDPLSLDSISKLSKEHLFTNDYFVDKDIIYLLTADSLYQIKRKIQ